MVFKLDRNFILFDYNMSHSQLVLRSFKKSNAETNLDIIFFGVSEIKMPINFDAINIEWEKANNREEDIQFTINKGGQIFCSFFNVIENKFDFAETSVFKDINKDCRIVYSSNSKEYE